MGHSRKLIKYKSENYCGNCAPHPDFSNRVQHPVRGSFLYNQECEKERNQSVKNIPDHHPVENREKEKEYYCRVYLIASWKRHEFCHEFKRGKHFGVFKQCRGLLMVFVKLDASDFLQEEFLPEIFLCKLFKIPEVFLREVCLEYECVAC